MPGTVGCELAFCACCFFITLQLLVALHQVDPQAASPCPASSAHPPIRPTHPAARRNLPHPCSGGRDGQPALSVVYASNAELQEFKRMEKGSRQGSTAAVAAYIQVGDPCRGHTGGTQGGRPVGVLMHA